MAVQPVQFEMTWKAPFIYEALSCFKPVSAADLDGRKALKIALRSPLQTAKLLAANKRAMKHLSKAIKIILPVQFVS